jgi:ABC-type polysaccharide/polyol phosphate transport system ATPase subunit
MEEITRLCNRGIWIEKGVLRADGPVKDVIAEYTAASSATP